MDSAGAAYPTATAEPAPGAHYCVACCIQLGRAIAVADRTDWPLCPPACPLCGWLTSYLTPTSQTWLADRIRAESPS